MPDQPADQIAKLQQSIASLEEQVQLQRERLAQLEQAAPSITTQSGGVEVKAEHVAIGGDVGGRDIVKSHTETITATNSALATGESAAANAGSIALNNSTVQGSVIIGLVNPSPAGWREAYLGWVLNEVRNVSMAGVDPKSIHEDTRADLELAAVYTELLTQRTEHERERLSPDRMPRKIGLR